MADKRNASSYGGLTVWPLTLADIPLESNNAKISPLGRKLSRRDLMDSTSFSSTTHMEGRIDLQEIRRCWPDLIALTSV
jgi:hypothetical protein